MIKTFIWFWKESLEFMEFNSIQFIKNGGIKKGIKYAKEMRRWNKLTEEQKLAEYVRGI